MCSDFLHYRVLPDYALCHLLVQVGNLRIRKREWFVGVYTAGESAMGWDWNPGLLRQTGAHDLAVSTEEWGWRAGQGVGALMGWKNRKWGSSEAQEQVQGWAQVASWCYMNPCSCLHSSTLLLLCYLSFHQRNTDSVPLRKVKELCALDTLLGAHPICHSCLGLQHHGLVLLWHQERTPDN